MSRAADNILQRTTILIRCETPDGPSLGTGFMFAYMESNDEGIPVVITNKHVMQNATAVHLTVTLSAPDNHDEPIGVAEFTHRSGWHHLWTPHPDPTVDLGAFNIATMLTALQKVGQNGYGQMFVKGDIITPEERSALSVVEDILMIGYPTGLSDKRHNLPLTRRGITASDPSVPYDGRRETMIDCACFPGSSGSPVVLKGGISTTTQHGQPLVISRPRRLIGVLWGGPLHSAKGDVYARPIPTNHVAFAKTNMMMNLGYIIHAERILELRSTMQAQPASVDFTLSLRDFDGNQLPSNPPQGLGVL